MCSSYYMHKIKAQSHLRVFGLSQRHSWCRRSSGIWLRQWVIGPRRSETSWWSQLLNNWHFDPWWWDRHVFSKGRETIFQWRSVISQKNGDLEVISVTPLVSSPPVLSYRHFVCIEHLHQMLWHKRNRDSIKSILYDTKLSAITVLKTWTIQKRLV
jgi:hypothetical protein